MGKEFAAGWIYNDKMFTIIVLMPVINNFWNTFDT